MSDENGKKFEMTLEAIFVLKRTLSTATVVIRSDYSKQFIVQ